jgi:hypothetical protein
MTWVSSEGVTPTEPDRITPSLALSLFLSLSQPGIVLYSHNSDSDNTCS